MNKEEIEELKDFTIDLTDIDELALGLEVCSKKAIYLIDDLIKHLFELQQENQSLKKENKILRENAEHNDKVVDKVNWENMLLKKENKQLKKIIDRASARLEYFLIGNLKYQSSQEEFIKLVNILKEVSK